MLYHLTARENIQYIRDSRCLKSSASLMEAANVQCDPKVRRKSKAPISVGSYRILLRDQAPLHVGHIEFEDGWDLVDDLNHRVFFWPGWKHKLIPSGLNYSNSTDQNTRLYCGSVSIHFADTTKSAYPCSASSIQVFQDPIRVSAVLEVGRRFCRVTSARMLQVP